MRRRGGSFHAEMDEEVGEEGDGVHFITPHYDGNDSPEPLDLSKLCLDDDHNSNDDDDGNEEQIYSRGRSRSRSVHENDTNNSNFVIANHVADSDDNGNKGRIQNQEKTGPLPVREVLTLKKGLEEASQQSINANLRNNNNSRPADDEEEERLAADAEKKQRQSSIVHASNHVTGPASSSVDPARRVKILMLGDSGVGKSSLILRWTLDTFSPSLTSTVGVNFKSKKVAIRGEAVQVQVWDTAGQEQFHKITTSYYKGAQGIMLVYDVTDQKSLDNVAYWIKNIKSHASDSVQVALVGNKTDLRVGGTVSESGKKAVDFDKGRDIAANFGVPFFETSAKESTNVNDGFMTLVTHIIDSSSPHKAMGIGHLGLGSGATNGASVERRSIVEKADTKGGNKLFSSLLKTGKTNSFSSKASSTADGSEAASPPDDKEKCVIS